MKRRLLSAACASVALVAITCAGERSDPRFATPPIEAPSRFLEVSGTIAPPLGLELLVEYQTSKDACRVTIDRFAGVDADRIFRSAVPVRRSGERFEASVALDLVAPGQCGWRVWGLNYVVLRNGRPHAAPIPPTPFVWFRADGREAIDAIRVECGGARLIRSVGQGTECWSSGSGTRFLTPHARALQVSFLERP